MKAIVTSSLMVLAMVGVLVASQSAPTSARFTDDAVSSSNAFSSGTINLKVNGNDNPSSLVTFTSPAMHPGDAVVAPLTISNTGSLPLRYALGSLAIENLLAGVLELTIKTGVLSCSDAAGFAASGTAIYGPGILGNTGGAAILGSSASGEQPGDRALAAAGSEVLCLQVQLPLSAPTTTQGLNTSAIFTFSAEQTSNN